MERALQVVVDTNALLGWFPYDGVRGRVSRAADRALESAETIGVPIIVCWEIGMLAALGKVVLDRPPLMWLERVFSSPGVQLLPLTVLAAVNANFLSDLETRDPMDRLIVATAMELGWPVVTSDDAIRRYPRVETIW